MPTETDYQRITDRVLALLESGTPPWRKPWAGSGPINATTGTAYRGSNVWELHFAQQAHGFEDPVWLTYKQAQTLGGSVVKGQKHSARVFRLVTFENDEGTRTGATLKTYPVFNFAQTEGCELPASVLQTIAPDAPPARDGEAQAIADRWIRGTGPDYVEHGNSACYSPSSDLVSMPPIGRFSSQSEFYSALFHELTHATGHSRRLNRDGVANPIRFGSHDYSVEELIAEMGATYLCAITGVETEESFGNSAAYLQGWRRKLTANPRWIVEAGTAAQRAVDLILGGKS